MASRDDYLNEDFLQSDGKAFLHTHTHFEIEYCGSGDTYYIVQATAKSWSTSESGHSGDKMQCGVRVEQGQAMRTEKGLPLEISDKDVEVIYSYGVTWKVSLISRHEKSTLHGC